MYTITAVNTCSAHKLQYRPEVCIQRSLVMPEVIPKPLPASIIHIDRKLFSISCLVRFLQGFAIFAVPGSSADSMPDSVVPASLPVASMCLGMGAGLAADRLLSLKWGRRLASCISTLALTAGFMILSVKPGPGGGLAAACLLGLGIGSEFSTFGEMARASLSNAVRWKGLRWWSTACVIGVSASIMVANFNQSAPLVTATAVSFASFVFLLCYPSKPKQTSPDTATTENSPTFHAILPATTVNDREGRARATMNYTESTTTESLAGQSPATEYGSTESACEATECCGGTQAVKPTSFPHGVIVNTVGWLVLLGSVPLAAETTSSAAKAWPASAISIGYLMLYSVAPMAGYAVAVLPFLLVGFIASSILAVVAVSGAWLTVTATVLCLASGATICACNAMIGELFSDCPTDAIRTRIMSVSLFATTNVLLCVGLGQTVLPFTYSPNLIYAAVFLVGLQAVRSLPSPIVSNLGSMEPPKHDDEELDDIIAAINS